MKVAVSAKQDNGLESLVDPLFGRCSCFIIVNAEDMSFEAFDNPNIAIGEGAGIQSARFLAAKCVDAVLTGHCGPKAVQELTKEGIEIIVDVMGDVRQVVDAYRVGKLLTTDEANVEEYFGRRIKNGLGEDRDKDQNGVAR